MCNKNVLGPKCKKILNRFNYRKTPFLVPGINPEEMKN